MKQEDVRSVSTLLWWEHKVGWPHSQMCSVLHPHLWQCYKKC